MIFLKLLELGLELFLLIMLGVNYTRGHFNAIILDGFLLIYAALNRSQIELNYKPPKP